jgi:phosphatidylserine decarboxylase
VARGSNERREIRIRDAYDREIMLVQLGSKTARQLICRLTEGKFVQAGAPIGMARIAGFVDIFVPRGCKLLIETGQHVIAGETVIAQFAPRPRAKRS